MPHPFSKLDLRTHRAIREKLLVILDHPFLVSHLCQQLAILVKERGYPINLPGIIRELPDHLPRFIKHAPHPIRVAILQRTPEKSLTSRILVILTGTNRDTIRDNRIIKSRFNLVYLVLKLTAQLPRTILFGRLGIIIRHNLSLESLPILG